MLDSQHIQLVEQLLGWLLVTQVGALVTLLVVGAKVLRFFNRIEWRTNILWKDLQKRNGGLFDDSDN